MRYNVTVCASRAHGAHFDVSAPACIVHTQFLLHHYLFLKVLCQHKKEKIPLEHFYSLKKSRVLKCIDVSECIICW